MESGSIIHDLAFLGFLNGSEGCKSLLELTTGARLASNILRRVSREDKVEALRNYCINNIAEYVKKNPKVSKEELSKFIASEVKTFSDAVSIV